MGHCDEPEQLKGGCAVNPRDHGLAWDRLESRKEQATKGVYRYLESMIVIGERRIRQPGSAEAETAEVADEPNWSCRRIFHVSPTGTARTKGSMMVVRNIWRARTHLEEHRVGQAAVWFERHADRDQHAELRSASQKRPSRRMSGSSQVLHTTEVLNGDVQA